MTNLRFITHLDVLAVQAQFYRLLNPVDAKKSKVRWMTDERMPHKTMLLRVQKDAKQENWLDDLPLYDEPEYETWKSLRKLLANAKKAIFNDPMLRDLVDPTAAPGRIVISVLNPDSIMMPHHDLGEYAKRHLRFHLALQTNPACLLYCKLEQMHLPVGGLAFLNALDTHWAVNWGTSPRAHVIFELRRRDAPDAE